jgi:hypothetical protein
VVKVVEKMAELTVFLVDTVEIFKLTIIFECDDLKGKFVFIIEFNRKI